MRKKFTICNEDGERYKPGQGEMLVMNSDGIFFIVTGMKDYYMGLQKLSDKIGNYDVRWRGEDEQE